MRYKSFFVSRAMKTVLSVTQNIAVASLLFLGSTLPSRAQATLSFTNQVEHQNQIGSTPSMASFLGKVFVLSRPMILVTLCGSLNQRTVPPSLIRALSF